MRSSSVILEELERVNREISELCEEEIRIAQRQAAIQDRLRALGFGRSDRGKQVELRNELQRAQKMERDEHLPTVVWTYAPDSRRYVVDKLSKNKIAVRACGTDRVLVFDEQGRPGNEFARERINVPATLVNYAAAMGDEIVTLA